VPPGLVIPRFQGPLLEHIVIRPLPDREELLKPASLSAAIVDQGADTVIEGSKDTVMALSTGEGKPVVCVATEPEALLLRQEIGDMCGIIAMKDPALKPHKDVAAVLPKAPQFLLVIPADAMPEGIDMPGWKKLCPASEMLRLPEGKDVIEAKKKGIDIWQWVANALKPALAPNPATKPKDIDVMEPGAVASLIPTFDVPALIKGVKDDLMAKIQPKRDLFDARKKEAMDVLRKELAKKGKDLDVIMKDKPPFLDPSGNVHSEIEKKLAQEMTTMRQTLTKQGVMNPKLEAEIAQMEGSMKKVLASSAKQAEQGEKLLADAKAREEAGTPDWAKKLLAGAGIDLDADPRPLRQLSRDEVVEMHNNGLSLATRNLQGLDLSGCNLKGADLKRANLQKADLTGANLDEADLRQAIATEVNLSGASLRGAKFSRGIFQKAKLSGADMSRADMTGAMMSEADFTGANLTGAILVKTFLEKAKLVKVRAEEARASQIYCLSADIEGADFSRADLTKGVFLKTNISGAKFSHATLRETAFLESKGEGLDFTGADMHNSRILLGSEMRNSNFTQTRADRASWMKSDLSGSDFRGSTIERGLLEGCDLSGCNFSGVKAKQARLTKSDLSDSDLTKINLFQGSLRKSKLVRTDLRAANLYGAEFYRTGVGETKLDEANLKMTKLHKRADLLPEPKDKKK
jgi:uncharacterized protein YjbI with pentapeptide repeats